MEVTKAISYYYRANEIGARSYLVLKSVWLELRAFDLEINSRILLFDFAFIEKKSELSIYLSAHS